jgi:hypothetical protein
MIFKKYYIPSILIDGIILVSAWMLMYGHRDLNTQIDDYYNRHCDSIQENDSCLVYLRDVTDFDWDEFYFIDVSFVFPSINAGENIYNTH